MKKTISETEYQYALSVINAMNIPTIKMPLQANIEDTEPTIVAYTSSTFNRIAALTGVFLSSVFELFFKNGTYRKPNFFTWIKVGKHAWVFIKSIIKTTSHENNVANISGTAHRVY